MLNERCDFYIIKQVQLVERVLAEHRTKINYGKG